MKTYEGTGRILKKLTEHPYIEQSGFENKAVAERLFRLNKGREDYTGPAVETTYDITARCREGEFEALEDAIHMILIHGTTEAWPGPEPQPAGYAEHMARLQDVKLLGVNPEEGLEAALVTIATPLPFFDQAESGVPLAQLRMATAVEPFNAFSDYTARVVNYELPAELKDKFVGQVWPHRRIRDYLQIPPDQPILGTIVKPKWLPKEHFAECVLETAHAGAQFIKSDENLHLTKQDLAAYIRLTVKKLEEAGFDLSLSPGAGTRRFLLAPHITANAFEMVERAKIAIDAGANVLMFSPHLAGDFEVIRQIYNLGQRYQVPVFSHCAGMNRYTGDPNYTFGEDPRTVYLLAALSGVAFMQLPATRGYIRPTDVEKMPIIERLRREGLEGQDGMTLVIAGGLGAHNIGHNMQLFGSEGTMYLAGTSVSHHPDGIAAGFEAIKLAAAAALDGIVEIDQLKAHAESLGREGDPLQKALGSG